MYQQYQPQAQQFQQQQPNPQAMQAQMLLQQLMQGAQQGQQQQGAPGSPQGQNTGLNKSGQAKKGMLGMSSMTDEGMATTQAATANANKSFSTPGYGF